MTIRAAILGASGYAGAELMRLCAQHPALNAVALYAENSAGAAVAVLYPHLAPAYGDAVFSALADFDPSAADIVFAALPHGLSQTLIEPILAAEIPFVDLGADFRLKRRGRLRPMVRRGAQPPDLLGRFAYGLPEIARAGIAGAKLVAAPGCYPTAAILALKPLLDAGLIEAHGVVVDALSGVSGAGRALKPETQFCAVSESASAYGLINHRHTAEMEQATGASILFTPHLAPMNRGILATCYGQADTRDERR